MIVVATYCLDIRILYDIICNGDYKYDFYSGICHKAISGDELLLGSSNKMLLVVKLNVHCQIFHCIQKAQVRICQLLVIED